MDLRQDVGGVVPHVNTKEHTNPFVVEGYSVREKTPVISLKPRGRGKGSSLVE